MLSLLKNKLVVEQGKRLHHHRRVSALGAVRLENRLVEDRLLVTFRRDLARPVDLSGSAAEVAFYESTYFYAFAATHPPDVVGGSGDCTTHVTPFDADTQLAGVQKTLATLGREETPSIDDVGALFADRIAISCE